MIDPSSSTLTLVSRNGMLLFSGSSVVNLIRGCCWLRWLRNDSMWHVFSLAKVLFRYLFQRVGGSVNVLSVFFSNFCMNSSAAKPDVDASIA